ncbi:hypothetical protein QUF74_02145 [Candidatus Halobeggiatoa sp. HSG11]|nr:hypothetical protein [Candidatus Halobeggiatoa sp. HSG11]
MKNKEKFSTTQKRKLEERRKNLIAQYEAIFNQLDSTLNWGDKISLKNQLAQIETEIKEVETEIEELEQGSPNKFEVCENTSSIPITNSSIDLYNHVKKLSKPLFDEICFYLEEQYNYDLSSIDVNGILADAARQLINFLKQHSQGLNHLQLLLEQRELLQETATTQVHQTLTA